MLDELTSWTLIIDPSAYPGLGSGVLFPQTAVFTMCQMLVCLALTALLHMYRGGTRVPWMALIVPVDNVVNIVSVSVQALPRQGVRRDVLFLVVVQ